MKKRTAFTLAESLVSLFIISAVFMAAFSFVSGYLKTTYARDTQVKQAMDNMNIAEELKAEVRTLPQLYSFSQGKEMKIISIGEGEIELHKDGTYTVISEESYGFSDSLKPSKQNIFRVEIGGSVPNSKIISVVVLK